MKILCVSQYFPPEIGAPSARVAELSKIWVEGGHQVTVLTGFPHHPTGRVPDEYRRRLYRLFMRDDRDGILVRRTWLIPLPNRKGWERMLTYASFCVSATLRGLFLPKPDVVIATSPQLLVGLAGLAIAISKRVPFVFEVRDLWPESIQAVGVSGEKSLLVRWLSRVAGMLYRKASHIVVVTPSFKTHLEHHWGVSPSKISVVVNGVDHRLFSPQTAPARMIQEFMLEGRFVVGYIGTMGNAHGPETLVSAAEILASRDPQVVFLIVGEGAEKAKLEGMVSARGLENLRVFPARPRSEIPSVIACSHACLVTLKKSSLFKTVIPTKMLEFMACGRPVVAAAEGEAAHLVTSAGAGVCTPPEDAHALAEAVLFFKANPEFLRQCGENARAFVAKRLTRDQTAAEYVSVLENVLKQPFSGKSDIENMHGPARSLTRHP